MAARYQHLFSRLITSLDKQVRNRSTSGLAAYTHFFARALDKLTYRASGAVRLLQFIGRVLSSALLTLRPAPSVSKRIRLS